MKYLLVLAILIAGCATQSTEEVIVHDTVYIDLTCYGCVEETHYKIDSLKKEFIMFMDSIAKIKIHDNLIIKHNSGSVTEARFDSATGKPYLIMR